MFWHIVDRTLTHLFWDPGLVLGLTFVLRLVARKTHWPWMPKRPIPTIAWACGVALPFIIAREPADLAAGGWLGKSYIDIAGHFVFIVAGGWGLYRLIMWGIEDACAPCTTERRLKNELVQ